MSVLAQSRDEVLMHPQSYALTAEGDFVDSSSSWSERLIEFLQEEYGGFPQSVSKYLQRNSDLAWTLLGAKSAVRDAFGDSVTVALELISDPDIDEKHERLFAYIRSTLPVNEALNALDRFDQEWLLERLGSIGGRLGFDLGF